MSESNVNSENWLTFENDDDAAAEYTDYDQQVELSPEDASAHHRHVRALGLEFGFPLPDWVPSLPSRRKSRH